MRIAEMRKLLEDYHFPGRIEKFAILQFAISQISYIIPAKPIHEEKDHDFPEA